MLRSALTAVVIMLMVATAPHAAAAPQTTCPAGTVWTGAFCELALADNANTPQELGAKGKAPRRVCTFQQAEIPCRTEDGYYDASRGCYVKAVTEQPPASDPVWEGRSNGVLFNCTDPVARSIYRFVGDTSTAPVDASTLATQLRGSMTFTPIDIGIVPEPGPGSVGLIGLPTWLWVANASPAVTGPQTRSLSSGGVDVTLTATVTSTRWEMGDGGVVTCKTVGTPYEDRYGTKPSPTCGYKYVRQGTYQVRAFTNWSATWQANTGEQGVFSWRVGSSTTITMGEAQVINTNP